MSQTTKRYARVVGATVIATAFLAAVLLTLQTRSPSQAASLGTFAKNTSTSTDILSDGYARITELNAEMGICSGVWVTETVDSTRDVGRYTSLALAPTYPYTPQISYQDVTSDSLKYAWLSGNTWLTETVDLHGGQWTSLALVPTYPYTPCISYHDYNWGWELRYACRSGITWTITAIGRGRAGMSGTSLALEQTYPYTPHISYHYPIAGAQNLSHAYLSGTAWYSGTWFAEPVERGSVGTWSSLELEPTHPYIPHISYYDIANGNLKHAWLSGTTWLSETVDSAGDVGWYTSLALDRSGNPHISYYDYTNGDLKYAWLSGTTWLSETVDSVGQSSVWYGWGTSLALNRGDAPRISYYDAINRDLKFAQFDGMVWIIETVDSDGDVGAYSSLALDQAGCPHISYYRDATVGDLKYAYLPPLVYYLPVIFKNF